MTAENRLSSSTIAFEDILDLASAKVLGGVDAGKNNQRRREAAANAVLHTILSCSQVSVGIATQAS